MFPRCGVPDAFDGWDDYERYVRFLYDTGSIDEHTQIWWSVRPHLAFPTVEVRICDAQPDLERGAGRSPRSCYSLAARFARALDEGEPLPDLPAPADRGEHLARDPLRPRRRADRPRQRRGAAGARGGRGADRVGAARRRGARRRVVPRASRRRTPPSARSRGSRRARRSRRSSRAGAPDAGASRG